MNPLSDAFFNPLQAIVNFGMAGLILAVVILPLMKWLLAELKQQRESFGVFLTNHSAHEIEIMSKIEAHLERLTLFIKLQGERDERRQVRAEERLEAGLNNR